MDDLPFPPEVIREQLLGKDSCSQMIELDVDWEKRQGKRSCQMVRRSLQGGKPPNPKTKPFMASGGGIMAVIVESPGPLAL